jgi:hypothetical protein
MSDMSIDGARVVGGGSGKVVRKGGSLCTNRDISCTVHHPRVAVVERIVMQIDTTRRENEPERNVLSNINYVCLLHYVTTVPAKSFGRYKKLNNFFPVIDRLLK